jgi:hypothetical protein
LHHAENLTSVALLSVYVRGWTLDISGSGNVIGSCSQIFKLLFKFHHRWQICITFRTLWKLNINSYFDNKILEATFIIIFQYFSQYVFPYSVQTSTYLKIQYLRPTSWSHTTQHLVQNYITNQSQT